MVCGFYLNKYVIYVYAHAYISMKIYVGVCMCEYVQLPWQMFEERIEKVKEVSTLEFMCYAQSDDPMIHKKIMF